MEENGISPEDRAIIEGHMRQVVRPSIERFGWYCQTVVSDYPVGHPMWFPTYGYTVGLFETLMHPEILIYESPHLGFMTLIAAVAEIVMMGSRVKTNEVFAAETSFMPPMPLKARMLDMSLQPSMMPIAQQYYRWSYKPENGGVFPNYLSMQVMWSDFSVKFPDEPGFNPTLAQSQPVLQEFLSAKGRIIFIPIAPSK